VRVAEQIAVLDNVARAYVVVIGVPAEGFEMAGADHAARGKTLEEYVDVMLRTGAAGALRVAGPAGDRHAEAGCAAHPMVARRGQASRGGASGPPAASSDAADEHRGQ
jgi:hypothetical protein